MSNHDSALVIGSNGGIGRALVHHWRSKSEINQVFAISRTDSAEYPDVIHCQVTAPERQAEDLVRQWQKAAQRFRYIAICTGFLHGNGHLPEKSLKQLNADYFQQSMHVNCFLPLFWLSKLMPLLSSKEPVTVAVLSARVGSIGDNRLGGWYSYRASKAALNMGLKSAAIELSRVAKTCKLLALHPGTTNTPLSAPFQHNVSLDKLFEADAVAEALGQIMALATADGKFEYLDYAGKPIPY